MSKWVGVVLGVEVVVVTEVGGTLMGWNAEALYGTSGPSRYTDSQSRIIK